PSGRRASGLRPEQIELGQGGEGGIGGEAGACDEPDEPGFGDAAAEQDLFDPCIVGETSAGGFGPLLAIAAELDGVLADPAVAVVVIARGQFESPQWGDGVQD